MGGCRNTHQNIILPNILSPYPNSMNSQLNQMILKLSGGLLKGRRREKWLLDNLVGIGAQGSAIFKIISFQTQMMRGTGSPCKVGPDTGCVMCKLHPSEMGFEG